MMPKLLGRALIGLVVLFLAIQAVPYGHRHSNPPTRQEPPWSNPRTRALAVQACYDCHSNETAWPWYAWVAPVSWLLEHDVSEGREDLNFSEWDRPQKKARDAAKEVREGDMPPWSYTLMPGLHRGLSSTERSELISGLAATLGTKGERP